MRRHPRSERRLALASASVALLAILVGGASPATADPSIPGKGFLPDDRAWEMISPSEKGFSDVINTMSRTQATPDGERVTFASPGAFAGAVGTAGIVQYLAHRSPSGWSTEALTPRQKSHIFSWAIRADFEWFSKDLTYAALTTADPAPVAGAPAGTYSLYKRNNPLASYDLLTPTAPPGGGVLYRPVFAGASADWTRILFESTAALSPDAPDDGTVKLYLNDGSANHLVGVLPDGTPAPGGSIAGQGATNRTYTERTISSDGSRVFFTAGEQLYVRLNPQAPQSPLDGEGNCVVATAACTIQVSASQRSTPDPEGPKPPTYLDASVDGSRVFFSSREQLLDADTNNYNDLYVFEVESRELALVSEDQNPADAGEAGENAEFNGLAGSSADGRTVYFSFGSALTPDAPTGDPNTFGVYAWLNGELDYITETTERLMAQSDMFISTTQAAGVTSRVTADGRFFTFIDAAPRPSFGWDTSRLCVGLGNPESCYQVWVYGAEWGEVRCASCPEPGVQPKSRAFLDQYVTLAGASSSGYLSRVISEDGRFVFFSSGEALVPEDTNGKIDAYEYDVSTGTVHLLSSGTGSDHSYFVDASADGKDAFFVTREPLSRRDRDNNVDLYDARIGGGFPEPQAAPPPCSGEGCQPGSGAHAAPPAIGSAVYQGPAKAKARRGKGRNHKVRKKRRGHERDRGKRSRHGKRHKKGNNKSRGRAAR